MDALLKKLRSQETRIASNIQNTFALAQLLKTPMLDQTGDHYTGFATLVLHPSLAVWCRNPVCPPKELALTVGRIVVCFPIARSVYGQLACA